MAGEVILAIDDNPVNLKLIKVLLSLENYKVITANDAMEALEILKNLQPDLILMDIQMPVMDGLELTRKLRENTRFKHTLIIAVTAYALRGDKEKTIAAGCDGYISKPIDINTFPQTISDYLKQKH